MVKIIFGCLFLVMALALGCNDDGGKRGVPPTPTPTPTPECSTGVNLEDFADCPTEGLAKICPDRTYGCNLFRESPEEIPEVQGLFSPQGELDREPCDYIDCFTMECDFLNESVFPEVHEIVVFSDISPVGELGNFTASAGIEGDGDFGFAECGPILP